MPTPPKKTSASSIGKKLPKEGSPKFVGPRSESSVEAEYSEAVDGKYNPSRGYKKRDRRADEIEDDRVWKKNPIQSLHLAVNDRIGRAMDLFMAPPGANRSTERARLAELIKAARKLKDPQAREKVLNLIQRRLSSYRQGSSNWAEDMPF